MNREYLIVDDEPDLCWALENLLTSKGLRCQKALSAQAALDLMKDHRFQLAFLDVTLPDMSGLELATRLHKLDSSLRFVIVSGFVSREAAVAAQVQVEGRICACINKPFRHEEVPRRDRESGGGGRGAVRRDSRASRERGPGNKFPKGRRRAAGESKNRRKAQQKGRIDSAATPSAAMG